MATGKKQAQREAVMESVATLYRTAVDTAPLPTPSLLQEAEATINGPRQDEYGDKLVNFSQIAMLFQGVLAAKLLPTEEITPEDVALLMIQVKIARLAKSPDHRDSILDVAGYAGCYDKLQKERVNNNGLLPGAIYDPRESEVRYKTAGGENS